MESRDSLTFGLDFYGERSVPAGVVGCLECIAPTGRERLASAVGLWVVGAPRMRRGSPIEGPPDAQT